MRNVIGEFCGRSEKVQFVKEKGSLWIIFSKLGWGSQEEKRKISPSEMEKWKKVNRERFTSNAR